MASLAGICGILPRAKNVEGWMQPAGCGETGADDALEVAMQLPFFLFENKVYCGPVTSGLEAQFRFHESGIYRYLNKGHNKTVFVTNHLHLC